MSATGSGVAARAIVVQQKTSGPVQFEIAEPTRTALADWVRLSGLASDDFLFPTRVRLSPYLSTPPVRPDRQFLGLGIGLDPTAYGTHSIRRTKRSLIYRRTQGPAGRAAPPRPHEAREHGSLPRYRDRRRFGDGGADRSLKLNSGADRSLKLIRPGRMIAIADLIRPAMASRKERSLPGGLKEGVKPTRGTRSFWVPL